MTDVRLPGLVSIRQIEAARKINGPICFADAAPSRERTGQKKPTIADEIRLLLEEAASEALSRKNPSERQHWLQQRSHRRRRN